MDKSEFYWIGYHAFHYGDKSTDNPYDAGSVEYNEWLEGFYDAGWDD